jgi:dephospho-CoA kinase
MKILGLTGGIGSGKSTVAKLFSQKGIPVYISDNRAKELMKNSPKLNQKIKALLGEDSYFKNGELNRPYISHKIFQDKSLLQKMNALVHPAVAQDFENWKTENNYAPFVIKESAILFESSSFLFCDLVISVVADENIRIQRSVERDGLTRQEIINRIKNQWTDKQRIERSDFVITNNSSLEELEKQVNEVYGNLV